jgi:hypothetical protein
MTLSEDFPLRLDLLRKIAARTWTSAIYALDLAAGTGERLQSGGGLRSGPAASLVCVNPSARRVTPYSPDGDQRTQLTKITRAT